MSNRPFPSEEVPAGNDPLPPLARPAHWDVEPRALQARPVPRQRVSNRPVAAASHPVAPRPDEHSPVEHGPVEHGPVEHGPVEHGPVEHGPVEHGPDDLALDHRPPSDLTNRELQDAVCILAAHIAAATCRWLQLVAELDRRQVHFEWGCRSTAELLSLRCGIALGAAHQHVRVARRLEELPAVRAAFAAGHISYCKVRALCRVAGPDTEAGLLELAPHATGAQLETIVQAYRGGTRGSRSLPGVCPSPSPRGAVVGGRRRRRVRVVPPRTRRRCCTRPAPRPPRTPRLPC